MLSQGCFYISIGAKAFGITMLIPFIVTPILFVMNAWTGDQFFFWLGLYTYLPLYIVWAFQRYFMYIRPDPVCQLYQTLAFPTFESMYIGGIIGLFIVYAYVYKSDQSWIVWLTVYLLGLGVPVVLVYMSYNVWWEVFFSMCFGFISALLFVYLYDWFIYPLSPYLMNHFPLWHLGYRPPENLKFEEIEGALGEMSI
jgi:hypothetical protein